MTRWRVVAFVLVSASLADAQVFRNPNDPSIDTSVPVVAVVSPTSGATYNAGVASTLANMSGTSSVANGIAICRWSNDQGGSGTANTSGNGDWLIPGILLTVGSNVITVSCQSATNVTGTTTLTVTRSASTNCTATTSISAGASPSTINSALASLADGGCLSFAAGSYSWGGTPIVFLASKGATLMCATVGTCNVTYTNNAINFPTTGSSTKLYRTSGFNFSHTSGTGYLFNTCPGGSCVDITLTQVRIDNNVFTLGGNEQVLVTDSASRLYMYGVVDHNTFNINAMNAVTFLMPGNIDTAPLNGRLGMSQNLFVEDNVFNITTGIDSGVGCIDGWGNTLGVVMRFNNFINCRTLMHGVPHSWGPENFELYGNAYTSNAMAALPTGYRSIHHQGSGEYATWGNSFTTTSHDPDTIVILHYRAFQPGIPGICDGSNSVDGNRSPTTTYRGYPCKHQPGRDYNGLLYPMFAFKNFWTDNNAKTDLVINNGGGASPDWTAQQLVVNRDIFNAVSATAQTSPTSPFNGTSGMGFGTLANRPTTCTTTTESADALRGGVLYWATDQGSWNTSTSNPHGVQQSGADGVLFVCSSTNTWTVLYTPYIYPHPLSSNTTTTYTTAFPTNQNPLSESSRWNRTDPTLTNVRVETISGTQVAHGTQTGGSFDDSTSYVSGFTPNHTITATIWKAAGLAPGSPHREVELLLRWTDTLPVFNTSFGPSHVKGYEINWEHSGQYMILGHFKENEVCRTNSPPVPQTGDLFKATITTNTNGSVTITAQVNGVTVLNCTESAATAVVSGSPGIGFYIDAGASNNQFGYSAVTITDN